MSDFRKCKSSQISSFLFKYSEFDDTKQVFINAFPWLFPGGVGDVWDPKRGRQNIRHWLQRLLSYKDGRFQKDHIFALYAYNMVQRHENNSRGNYFINQPALVGPAPPTVEELKERIRGGDDKFISVLQYYSGSSIRGSDAYWRAKTNELKTWIDFMISCKHGPPNMFITLSCAENWWPDLMRILIDMERNAGNFEAARKIEMKDFTQISKSARNYPLVVNQFFMIRAEEFMKTVVKNTLGVDHYWGRVEFAPGRGQIHLHILAVTNKKGYLQDYHNACTIDEKTVILTSFAYNELGMTADVELNDSTDYKIDCSPQSKSALRLRFCEVINPVEDASQIAQDTMKHSCNAYCLDDNGGTSKGRKCRMRFGTETEYGKQDTEGKELRAISTIIKDSKGISHLELKRTKSRRLVQFSKPLLQGWRANCDIQLLIYNSDPLHPNLDKIEAVTRYVVAYTGKKHHTNKQEKEQIQNIIKGYVHMT